MVHSPSLTVWLDPGKVTGWATWRPADDQFLSGQVTGLLEAANRVRDIIGMVSAGNLVAIGWEAFTIRPGSAHLDLDTTALEVIGAVQWIAAEAKATVLKPQQPSDRTLGQKHLATLGWHRPGPDHADSAASHLLSYLITTRQLPAELLAKITEKMEQEGHER